MCFSGKIQYKVDPACKHSGYLEFFLNSIPCSMVGEIKHALAPVTGPKRGALTCDGSWACLVNGEGWVQPWTGYICFHRKGWHGLHRKSLYCPPQRAALLRIRTVQPVDTTWSSLFFLWKKKRRKKEKLLADKQKRIKTDSCRLLRVLCWSSPAHVLSCLPQWALKETWSPNSCSISSILPYAPSARKLTTLWAHRTEQREN